MADPPPLIPVLRDGDGDTSLFLQVVSSDCDFPQSDQHVPNCFAGLSMLDFPDFKK